MPNNRAPKISGTAAREVQIGSSYSFTPSAFDADGDTLLFSIDHKPTWATFNTLTGRLTGTPQSGDEGTYSNVLITVSDGKATTSLAAFSITVSRPEPGTATLSWVAPTSNEDGSTLTNLSGYRIVYGPSASMLHEVVEVANAGLTTYTLENLTPGTYYFAIKAYTSSGVESGLSNVVSKSIR